MGPWQTEITEMIRYAVGDVNTPQTYTDARLEKQAVIAAQFVRTEVSLANTYVIDIPATGISPDPTLEVSRDNPFITLIVLKAACMIASNEFRIRGGQSMKVVEGTSSFDTSSRAGSAKNISESFCKQYEDAKFAYATNQLDGVNPRVRFVTTPFRYQYGGNDGWLYR